MSPSLPHRPLEGVTRVAPQAPTGVLRPFPSPNLAHVDPFVFLDTGAPTVLGERTLYVGPHPHRGVQPVSLLFRGHIEHRDSLGHHRTVTSGGMQWLVSGAGALHEEVLGGDDDGVFHMAQLWVNLPSHLKMSQPSHHAIPSQDIPVLTTLGEGATIRLYAGTLGGIRGPAPMPTPVTVAHVILQANGTLTVPAPSSWNVALTVVDGALHLPDHSQVGTLTAGDTPVFRTTGQNETSIADSQVTITTESGGEFLLMMGEPIGEPIEMGGGFVMTSPQEIKSAYSDLKAGKMGHLEAQRP